MAVESFLKPSDTKNTVEKTVRPKPSVADLTTVEVPGKPSPASMLEEGQSNKKSGRKTKRYEKKEANEVRSPVKDSVLIITEKPQAAMKIASALGKAKKYSEGGVSHYEVELNGKKIVVASAVGHLFNLTYKAGQKGWPIYELEWVPSFVRKESAFTKKYYDVLKKLARKAEEFYVATDFDTEGEVIGWNVLRFICKERDAKRMKYSTLTAPELLKAYENPMPTLAWGNAYAGETRHFIDWMYGINLSRALMSAVKRTGSFKIMSIGRVQGPALKIIVDREREIAAFKPEPYWQVFAESNGVEFKHPKDIFDKKELAKFENIKEGDAKTKNSEEHIPPGVPFDLTTLQREAYRVHKINPAQTLQIAQKLYLEGIISYPRTSSQKIPNEIEPKKILKALEKHFPFAKNATRPNPYEGKKTDPAHPSIYPTGDFASLSEQDEKLYNLIVKRFIACFSPDAVTANKHITLISKTAQGDVNFTASGLVVLNKGWTENYPVVLEEKQIPDMNGKYKIDKIEFIAKETQPPNRYTPASLVSILEKKNLGTKATRSMIVETLFDRGYLDGKSITATPLGMKLIEALEKYSSIIVDENLTRQLEEEMENLQENKDGNPKEREEAVIKHAKKIIEDISKEFKTKEEEIGKELMGGIKEAREEQRIANTLMACPKCQKGDLRIMFSKKSRRSFVACSAYPACTNTYSLPPNSLIKKSDKICEADKFPKLLAIRKGKRPWEFCFNPECPIEKEKREEWAARKNNTFVGS